MSLASGFFCANAGAEARSTASALQMPRRRFMAFLLSARKFRNNLKSRNVTKIAPTRQTCPARRRRGMRTVTLSSGQKMPILGQGTWGFGERGKGRADAVAALRHGIDRGLTLIDTAEMYGEGGAEEIVGEAVAGRRDEVFLVSKVYPHNASRKGAIAACERSLKRLATDRIHVYLLHWRGDWKLSHNIAAFQTLLRGRQ